MNVGLRYRKSRCAANRRPKQTSLHRDRSRPPGTAPDRAQRPARTSRSRWSVPATLPRAAGTQRNGAAPALHPAGMQSDIPLDVPDPAGNPSAPRHEGHGLPHRRAHQQNLLAALILAVPGKG